MNGVTDSAAAALARRFSALVRRLDGGNPALSDCVQRLILAVAAGHGCLDLSRMERAEGEACLSRAELLSALAASQVVGRAGQPGFFPIVLDGSRLYLKRGYDDECLAARKIAALCAARETYDPRRLEAIADAAAQGADPGQRAAVRTALDGAFTVITGGPGTGKTATAVRVMAAYMLLAREKGQPDPRIALAAPTGKAAARLAESIKHTCAAGGVPAELVTAILAELDSRTFTLHRLLGFSQARGIFHRGADNPLNFDLVMLDESSMCSLTLTARLLAALPGGARLVMLGDKDQLASVEAGAVLGDICRAGLGGGGPLSGRIAELTENHRSAESRQIAAAAAAVRRGDCAELTRVLGEARRWAEDGGAFRDCLDRHADESFAPIAAADSAEEALRIAQRFRIIAAANHGSFGVEAINRRIKSRLGFPARGHYRGEPVMATLNDYDLKVFNGDVGIVWDDGGGAGRLAAWFSSAAGALVPLPIARFSALEPFYAASVHKSQGSEYQEVFFVLPGAGRMPTRELVYTAVTRASRKLTVWSSTEALGQALERRTERYSGLEERLRGVEGG